MLRWRRVIVCGTGILPVTLGRLASRPYSLSPRLCQAPTPIQYKDETFEDYHNDKFGHCTRASRYTNRGARLCAPTTSLNSPFRLRQISTRGLLGGVSGGHRLQERPPGNTTYLLRCFWIGFLILGLCRFGTDLARLVGVAIVVSIAIAVSVPSSHILALVC